MIWLSLHTPYDSLLTINLFDLLSSDTYRITDSEVLLPIDPIRDDELFFVEESFDSLDGDEEPVVELELDIAIVDLSDDDVGYGEGGIISRGWYVDSGYR